METRVILILFCIFLFCVQQINTTNCRVCIKELTNENGYDPVTVNMLVIGEQALSFKKKHYTQVQS